MAADNHTIRLELDDDHDFQRGITLELSPDIAEELRRRNTVTGNTNHQDANDDWNDLMVMAPPSTKQQQEEKEPETAAGTYYDKKIDDDVSYSSPPDSLPVVLVHMQRMVGYLPTEERDIEQLQRQMRAALWGQEVSEDDDESLSAPDDDLLLNSNFDERVGELFERGVARHSDTTQVAAALQQQQYVVVPYPEYLCRRRRSDDDAPVLVNTAHTWKRLLMQGKQSSNLPAVVIRLLQRLVKCSRSLLWKDDMLQEILELVGAEEKAAVDRQQEEELSVWRNVGRKEQLDKLYTVREAFEHGLEMARGKQERLEAARDALVATEIRKRRVLAGEPLGLEAFDFSSTVFAFPSEEEEDYAGNLLGLHDSDNEEADEDDDYIALMSGSDAHESDDKSEDEEVPDNDRKSEESWDEAVDEKKSLDNEEADDEQHEELEAATSNVLLPQKTNKDRRQAAAHRRRQRLKAAAAEAEHRSKLEAALAQEEQIRQECTTVDLKMAIATANALEEKLKKVDQLMDTLQEEEWEDGDDEEGIDVLTSEKKATPRDDASNEQQFTLLDQILAMILGASPPADGVSMEEHAQCLEQEHRTIVNDWREHFGRLPPGVQVQESSRDELAPTIPTRSDVGTAKEQIERQGLDRKQESMKRAFGIVDNDRDDWEEQSDDEQAAAALSRKSAAAAPKVMGLRPGCRLR